MAKRKDPVTGRLLVEGVSPQVSERTGVVTYRARVAHGSGRHRQYVSETFKTAKAAEEWILERRLNVSRGAVVDVSQMTVGEFYERWIKRHQKNITGSRYTGIRSFWKAHGEPAFGDMKIQAVTRQHIQVFVDQLDDKYTAKTVQNYSATLRSLFAAAEVEEVIYRTPFRNIHLPTPKRGERTIWSPLQMRRFLQATRSHPYGGLWAFMIATGCRVSEAIALKPDSLWIDDGMARIWRTETVDENGQRVIEERTKNSDKGHYVKLEQWILDILRVQPKGVYVFMHGDKRIPYPHVLDAFRDASEAAGLPTMNLHGLRHSVISALGNAGIDDGTIQSITGHANRRSLETYMHRTVAGQELGTKQLARLLGFEDDRNAENVVARR